MPRSARCCALLLLAGLPAPSAFAQPDYRIPAVRGQPAPSALVAQVDIGAGMQFGAGRVRVFEPARLRSHTEPEPRPHDVRRRERSIAAVRFSVSF